MIHLSVVLSPCLSRFHFSFCSSAVIASNHIESTHQSGGWRRFGRMCDLGCGMPMETQRHEQRMNHTIPIQSDDNGSQHSRPAALADGGGREGAVPLWLIGASSLAAKNTSVGGSRSHQLTAGKGRDGFGFVWSGRDESNRQRIDRPPCRSSIDFRSIPLTSALPLFSAGSITLLILTTRDVAVTRERRRR